MRFHIEQRLNQLSQARGVGHQSVRADYTHRSWQIESIAYGELQAPLNKFPAGKPEMKASTPEDWHFGLTEIRGWTREHQDRSPRADICQDVFSVLHVNSQQCHATP